jgi:hypothetical protein
MAIINNLSGCYELTDDIDFSKITHLHQSAIHSTFSGILFGQGFTLSNLTINAPSRDEIGLFMSISGSTITDLTLDSFDIKGQFKVGGLAGRMNGSTVSTLTLTNSAITGKHTIGGIAGEGLDLTISDSHLSNITITGIIQGRRSIGGLVGTGQHLTLIDNTLTQLNITGDNRLGGLVGELLMSQTSSQTSVISNTVMTHITITGVRHGNGGMVGVMDANLIICNSTLSGITVQGQDHISSLVGNFKPSGYNLSISGVTIEATILADPNTDYTFGIIIGKTDHTATLVNTIFTGTVTWNGVPFNYPKSP